MVEPHEINIMIADVIIDLLDSATIFRGFTRRPKTIFALQDYLTIYLLPRTTPDVRSKIQGDQILSHIIWQMLIGGPFYTNGAPRFSQAFLLSEGKLDCKYYTDRKSMLDFMNNQSDKWWTKLSKIWMKKTGNYLNLLITKHATIEKQYMALEQLLLPKDINSQIISYIVGPQIARALYVR